MKEEINLLKMSSVMGDLNLTNGFEGYDPFPDEKVFVKGYFLQADYFKLTAKRRDKLVEALNKLEF